MALFLLRCVVLLLVVLEGGLPQGRAADFELTLEEGGEGEGTGDRPVVADGMGFRFVSLADPAAKLDDQLFWRPLPSHTAASATWQTLQVDGADVIAPYRVPDERPWRNELVHPTAGRKEVGEGRHRISPGAIEFRVEGGRFQADHPALAWSEESETVRILCVPVRFGAVDDTGCPVPFPLDIFLGRERLFRSAKAFNPFIAWLPVGLSYASTFGQFAIDADGTLKPGTLGDGVTVSPDGLRRTVSAAPPQPPPAGTVALRNPREPDASITLKAFLTPWGAPGGALALALRRAAATRHVGDDPAEQIRLQPHPRAIGSPGVGRLHAVEPPSTQRLTKAPSAAWERAAAAALAAAPGELEWFRFPLPVSMYGHATFLLSVGELRGTVSALVADLAQPLHLLPHRGRRVFAAGEAPVFHALAPRGFAGGAVDIAARTPKGRRHVLGTVALPAVPERRFDSRSFTLDLSALPAGQYGLQLERGRERSGVLPITVRPWSVRSPFFLHTMSCCTGVWPSDPEGLRRLRDMGYEMLTMASGHGSTIAGDMPGFEPALARVLDAPGDLGVVRRYNDYVYDNFLAAGLRHIDNTVIRKHSFYLESLSYHHSYQPSVDRMVRRLQIFTQQTADYPSFWGTNFSWFPQLHGYAEGGVPTDGHRAARNAALAAALEKAGFSRGAVRLGEPVLHRGKPNAKLTRRNERKLYDAFKTADDGAKAEKAQAFLQAQIDTWAAEQDFGFGRHNQLYTDAIRQVRPETVTTLFENAGHDGAKKRTRDLFRGMAAACYESYTDFGEWPLSPAFTTDWARAELPEKPVWVTMDWGCSDESLPKSLLYAFVRGLAGGGVPMQADAGWEVLNRRGKVIRFFQQYGALAQHGVPDGRFGLLTTLGKKVMDPRGYYNYHALYYHLTRLGAPPRLLPEERFWKAGIPASVQALFIAQQDHPYDGRTVKMLAAFQARGGTVVQTSDSPFTVAGALTVKGQVRDIWELSGFHPEVHQELWEEFLGHWREPLEEVLGAVGVPRLATTDPEKAIAIGMEAGPVRYVAVLSDAAGTHASDVRPLEGLEVSLAGTGWLVRDLARQVTLAGMEKAGRTEVQVDLVNEPATLLALCRSAPQAVTLAAGGATTLGQTLHYAAEVLDGAGQSMGPVPLKVEVIDPANAVRETSFQAAGERATWAFAPADQAGDWTLSCQELLTGRTVRLRVPVAAAAAPLAAAKAIGEVHVVDPRHVEAFVARKETEPVWVMLEAGQEGLLPLARRVVAGLAERGVEARLWQLKPEEIAPLPQRWVPRPADVEIRERIAAGELVGYRINLEPYVDEKSRVHIPDRGGYASIDPPYMVGADCVVFAGGALCESLRALSPWLPTSNIPGRGQGRLLVAFSPFMAGKHCAALLGNDAAGLEVAADALLAAYETPASPAPAPPAALPLSLSAKGTETAPVPIPYANYIPTRRIRRLLGNAQGAAAVFLKGKQDNLVFVDAAGAFQGSVAVPDATPARASLDEQGRVWDLQKTVTSRHPGWGFPTGYDYALRAIGPGGEVQAQVQAFTGSAQNLPPNHTEGFLVAPAGDWALLGRRGGFLWGPRADASAWQWYDDVPHTRDRWEVRTPRWPVGATVSPNGRYLLCTMDTRPRMGGMGVNQPAPTSCTTLLYDREKKQLLWQKRAEDWNAYDYALFAGFAAVADTGRAAFCDYAGVARVVEPSGTVLYEEALAGRGTVKDKRAGPIGGVGVAMDRGGRLAAFAFRETVELVDLTGAPPKVASVAPGRFVAVAVAADGTRVLTGLKQGLVQAFDAAGEELWSATPGGIEPHVAAVGRDALVATSAGELVRLDAGGDEVWRADLAGHADRERHPLAPAEGAPFVPLEYRPPQTLAWAKKHLQAEALTGWKPQGGGEKAFGQTFYSAAETLKLTAKATEGLVHLVYRRPAGNQSLTVVTKGGDGTETFWLDLPTPEYRVVDLPVRGPQIEVELQSDGPVQVAAFSLHRIAWPGANLAYVKPAGTSVGAAGALVGEDEAGAAGEDLGDLAMGGLEDDGSQMSGMMKDCVLYSWNPDPDQVAGRWLRVPVPPLAVVDGTRFGNGRLKPMTAAGGGKSASYRGVWWTIKFPEPVTPRVVAYYDRANRQSQVARNLSVFTAFAPEQIDGGFNTGRVLSGVVGNDQFWRLFPAPSSTPLHGLGVQAYVADDKAEGMSEVEIY